MLTVVNTGAELTRSWSRPSPNRSCAAGRTSSLAGVGLGLAIVKSIAEANDGTLTLAPGFGAGGFLRHRNCPPHRPSAKP